MQKDVYKIKKVLISVFLSALLLVILTGCTGVFYVPGASYGYYIWEDDGSIFVEWSADRKDTKFSGSVLTDGQIAEYSLKDWEENDELVKTAENIIEFSALLNKEDFSDGFSFIPQNYTYIEFDLKINGEYDLSRINVGGFLENPEDNVFRIEKDYFDNLREKHFYEKRPFSEFFYKLYSNKYFTFLYVFIIGVIVIEILRITALANKKRKAIWVTVAYAALILIEVCIYFILRFLV